MSTQTFDLTESISRLLTEMEQGRVRMKTASQLLKLLEDAQESYATAVRKWQEFKDTTRLPNKYLLSWHRSRTERLSHELTEKHLAYKSAISFIGSFRRDLDFVLQRLPLNNDWTTYRTEIAGLRIADAGAWLDPPSSPDLATLEFRLREMLDLATGGKRKNPVRRNRRYADIDEALREIAESCPRTQQEVFELLEGREVSTPPAAPFSAARGWMAGFRRDERAARAWLSKRWAILDLPPLPKGPKKK
jgi:hypothetical protein